MQIEKIVYALTVRSETGCPNAIKPLQQACGGELPEAGPELFKAFEGCGGREVMVELWAKLIANDPQIAVFAEGVWKGYQDHIAKAPSLLQQAGSLSTALVGEIKALGTTPPVETEESDRRFGICQSHLGDCFLEDGRCSKCFCYMKAKTTFRTASCPLGNW
jgi:hypothetical protein